MNRPFILALLFVFYLPNLNANEIHKCFTKDGQASYSDIPCKEGKSRKLNSDKQLDLKKLTDHQANTLNDCREAFDDLYNREPGTLLNPESDRAKTLPQFEKLCPQFGFRISGSPADVTFNMEHTKKLGKLLDDYYSHIPSFTRSYSGGGRNPPLFTGY